MTATASTGGARDHARAQAAAAIVAGPDLPDTIDPANITFAQRIPSGGYATVVLGRGSRVRLGDPGGTACAHLLLLRAEAPWERLNVADTVKVPWQAYLGDGHPLLSDQGRILATVTADRSGHHDALCGPSPAARHALRLAGTKHGLAQRDIGPTLSFFRGVRVRPDGALLATGGAGAGATLDLLIHLPVTLLVANAGHPLEDFPGTDLDVVAWPDPGALTAVSGPDPEYRRAVAETDAAWTAARTPEVLR